MAREQRYMNWMVTCFDLENFAVPDGEPNFKYMVYQVEECPETKLWHIQGYLELRRQTNLGTVKQMFHPVEVHLERRRGTRTQAIAYCTKPETRIAEPTHWGDGHDNEQGRRVDLEDARQRILRHTTWEAVLRDPELTAAVSRHITWAREVWNSRPLEIPPPQIELRKWQKKVVTMLDEEPVNRRIIWIYSYASGTGKTTFYNYCSAKYDVLPGADWANTLYIYNSQRVIWFDRTRAESGNERNVDQFYIDLERWSNHAVQTSTKYQPVRKYVRIHVVVTANGLPDEQRLPGRFISIEAKHAIEEEVDDEGDVSLDLFEDNTE